MSSGRGRQPALGLARGKAAVSPYDARWPSEFSKESENLGSLLAPLAPRIEHVGSTAVPGLAAKPVIDIAVGFEVPGDVERARALLVAAGYDYRGDFGDRGGVIVAKGPDSARTHLLHLVAVGDDQWRRYLLFRDALRGNPLLRDRYAALKLRLAPAYWNDRNGYVEAKRPLIDQIVGGARATEDGR